MDTLRHTVFRARSLIFAALAVVVCYLLLHWPAASSIKTRRSRAAHDASCNPYDQHGYFEWSQDAPNDVTWIALTGERASQTASACSSPAPDWIRTLEIVGQDLGPRPSDSRSEAALSYRKQWKEQQDAFHQLRWLQNRTILIVGDSVDRNALDHLGYFSKSSVVATGYLDASIVGNPEGWDIRGVPHVVHMQHLDAQVANVFFYGADDEDTFKRQVDWHAPGRAEERLRELFLPFTRQLKYPPSFIQYHSGTWDIALFGRQDAARGKSTNTAIDPDRVRWWFARQRSVIAALRSAYPNVPIWFRTSHRVGSQGNTGSTDYVVNAGIQLQPDRQNFFSDLRCGQLRQMQMAIAEELGLPINDFGRRWEGYQAYQDKVHPLPWPGGVIYVNPLLNNIYLDWARKRRSSWFR